jgi:dipeptidyl aminopeptidase/acylaminoacyl peptidase
MFRTLAMTIAAASLAASSPDAAGQAIAASAPASLSSSGYKTPPDAIRRVLDTPPTPFVSISPDDRWMVLLERRNLPSIADLAAPMLRLGGSRLNPNTNGSHGPRPYTGFVLRPMPRAGEAVGAKDVRLELPPDAALSGPSWSADGNYFTFTNTINPAGERDASGKPLPSGTELWVCDVEKGTTKRLAGPTQGQALNGANGVGVRWMPDQRSVLVSLVPEGRGALPERPTIPSGPVIQDAGGTTAPVRTYQDLLTDTYDETLFDWIMTGQLAVIDVTTGAMRTIGAPAIHAGVSPSPSGEYLLVGTVKRPYSYAVPWSLFPQQWDVIETKTAKLVRTVVEMPLRENIPTQGVQTGPRGLNWLDTQPATLLWTEALDGGDPLAKVPHRDRCMMLDAPFAGDAREWMKLQHRASGMSWLEPPAIQDGPVIAHAMVGEYERERRWIKTWMVSLDVDGGKLVGEPRLVFDRSINDQYNDPGSPLTRRLANGVSVIRVEDGHVYLDGEGATPEGNRPFLDRMSLADFSKERLWRNEGPCYEVAVDVLHREEADAPVRVITSYETRETPPNYFIRDLASGERMALTTFTDPLPELRKIRREIITYTRDDGAPLSATMYLPPDYADGTRLPLFIWAYPNEVSDTSTAGQVSGSEYRFTQIGGSSHLFLLLAGYAVMDNASMPVIGDPETVNDTFVTQIVANAQAAIDKATEMGVADPRRVAVGGHSYGAFMTANLLAHCPPGMFKAGIARSGAYNRTLTPFGFQSERRSFWEAPEVYVNMSPFTHADKIKTPLLMIHGQLDNNSGTFPIQSERLFQAVKGTGGTARLVMLPYESHGYAARESVMHVLAESIEWLDKYVKNASEAPAVGSEGVN